MRKVIAILVLILIVASMVAFCIVTLGLEGAMQIGLILLGSFALSCIIVWCINQLD